MRSKTRKTENSLIPASRRVYPGGTRINRARRSNERLGCAPRERASFRGFTLVEILMVITTIAILMTITIGVVGSLIGQARESATATSLSKIQSLMDSRRRAFDRLIQRKGFLTGSFEYQYATQLSKLPALNMPATAIKPVASKLLQMKYFPQSSADLNFLMFTVYSVNGPNSAAQLQFATMYPKLFQSFTPNPASFVAPAPLPNLTNAEILYNVLTENVIGDSPLGTDAFSSSEVQTEPAAPVMKTAGFPYFVDSWKNPIRFYRWPTRLFRSGGTGVIPSTSDVQNAKLVFSALPVFTGNLQNDLQRDPDDPLQTCASITNFESFFGTSAFHTPATFHMPLIVSAGPDGFLGLGEPDAADVTGTNPVYGRLGSLNVTATQTLAQAQDQVTDNIVSASIKAGGK